MEEWYMSSPKCLVNELYYLRFSLARERFVEKYKSELSKFVSMLAEFRQTGSESLKLEIESARVRLIRSDFGPDDVSVSIDIINSLERDFLLQEVLGELNKENKKSRSFLNALLTKV
jgi:hypothetical protein